jgi:undecaprenyl-diphosphatase
VDLVLKPLIERPRPPGALLLIDGSSFPSGHAAGAVVFSLVLAAVASRHRPDHARQAFGLSAGWIALVGLSTLVVRAHWPSDVLGGYAVGLAWVTLCLTVWRHRSRRR